MGPCSVSDSSMMGPTEGSMVWTTTELKDPEGAVLVSGW